MSAAVGLPCASVNFTSFQTPWGLTVTVNKAVLPRFKAACEEASEHPWKPKRIDSYNCRQIRGSSSWSRHAYAAAWDFFDKPYPQPVDVWGPTNSPPASFAAIFEKYGFTWGGHWTRQDWPHIEWSDPIVPELETKGWDEMASEAEIRKVIKEEIESAIAKLAVGKTQAKKGYDSEKVNLKAAIDKK